MFAPPKAISSSDTDSNLLEEWKQSRDVLKTFDDRIHDLRKYGFTFITGLLTAQGLLLPGLKEGTAFEPAVKFGVLVATMLLIIILRWFDGNYQGFLYGASMRARVIERFLNFELTNQIAVRYEVQKLWLPKIILYGGFQAAVILLAFALLPDRPYWIFILFVASLIESILYYIFASPQKLSGPYGADDWTLDRLQYKEDDEILLMVTNFNAKHFSWTELAWKTGNISWNFRQKPWIIKDGRDRTRYFQEAKYNIDLQPGRNYIWSIKPRAAGLTPGIYRIIVNYERSDILKKETRELGRKLRIV